MAASKRNQAHVFLLRCWREDDEEEQAEGAVWRFMLETIEGGEKRSHYGFTNLEQLHTFLQDKLNTD